MKRKIARVVTAVLVVAMAVAMVGCGKKNMKGKKDPGSALKGKFSATIEETVIIDEAGVKITATDLSYTDYSADLELLIENNTDRNLSFYAGTIGNSTNSVNGYMMSGGYIGEDVAAGMSVTTTVDFDIEALLMYGIEDIADITLGIEIEDENYDEYLPLEQKTIKTSIADKYDYKKDTFAGAMDNEAISTALGFTIDSSTKEELVDKQGIKSLCAYAVTNKEGAQALLFEVINNSDKDQYVTIKEVELNGILAYGGRWDSQFINAGKRAVLYIDTSKIMDADMKTQYGIDKFSKIAFTLGVHDSNHRQIGDTKVELVFGSEKKVDQSGEVVYQANDLKFISKGISKDEYGDLHILFLVQNIGNKELEIDSLSDVYIQKKKAGSAFISATISPGTTTMVDAEVSQSDYEEVVKDIKDIKNISMQIEIRDENYNEIDTPTLEIKIK